MADVDEDPYVYPGTDCLRNKLGIEDSAKLALAEARIVSARDVELARKFLPGTYNLEHLKKFHKRLFGDLYDWAGKVRYVDIYKDEHSAFCNWRFIDEQVSAQLAKLQREDLLIGLNVDAFVDRLAYYYGELNVCHPFREGNGRTLRAFLRQLGASAGFALDWSEINQEDNVAACKHHMHTAEITELVPLLSTVVRRI